MGGTDRFVSGMANAAPWQGLEEVLSTGIRGQWIADARIHGDDDVSDVAVEGALQQHLGPTQPFTPGRLCQLGAEEDILHAAQLSDTLPFPCMTLLCTAPASMS